MNAIQFIKEHGVEKAREVVEGAPDWATGINLNSLKYFGGDCFCGGDFLVSDLKRLVVSVELVKEHYTLDRAKSYAASPYTAPEIKERLEQAIADYEAIHSFDIEKREFELGLAPDSDYVKGGEHV